MKELQFIVKLVAMQADSINGAPALSQADVGMPSVQVTDVVMGIPDIVIMNSDLFVVIGAIILNRARLRKRRQNL